MKLIVCLDDRNGIQFAGRRQSRDKVVCDKIKEISSATKLWMNTYSAQLFDPKPENLCVDDSFLELAGDGEFCFAECIDGDSWKSKTDTLIVFRWNRHYPADMLFLDMPNWSCAHSEDFQGSSHDKITMEVYSR